MPGPDVKRPDAEEVLKKLFLWGTVPRIVQQFALLFGIRKRPFAT